NATVTVRGNAVTSGSASAPITLVVGSNVIPVVVTAQDGSTVKNYSITITRATPPATNANLSNLITSAGALNPVFAATTLDYTVSVANNVTSVTVTPTLADANATVTVRGNAVTSGSASAPITLVVGSNVIPVVVTAQDGSTVKNYSITVMKAAAPGTNANLSNLITSAGALNPTFTANTLAYTVGVINSVNSITITPTLADANATVKVKGINVASGSASAPINLVEGDNVIPVAVTAQDGSTVKNYSITINRAGPEASITFSGKVFLQGAYSTTTGNMSNALNTLGILKDKALSQPYNVAPFNYSGGETVGQNFFAANTDIVDWVLIELRSQNNPSTIVARRAAFVKRDGTIVETEGSSTQIYFDGLVPGRYHVSIRHRNHLGIRSANAVDFTSGTGTANFTTSGSMAFQNQANTPMVQMGTVWVMRGGNANANNNVKYNGPANDQDRIQNGKLGGSLSLVISNQYSAEDVNLDGSIKTNGPANDQNFLLNIILSGLLSNIFTEQID
ncbi:cadherin-like beta sandwich domain-containing protein, partial [Segetibacter sp. 3557_3]